MREICTSGSVGDEGGNVLVYPATEKKAENGFQDEATGSVGAKRTFALPFFSVPPCLRG